MIPDSSCICCRYIVLLDRGFLCNRDIRFSDMFYIRFDMLVIWPLAVKIQTASVVKTQINEFFMSCNWAAYDLKKGLSADEYPAKLNKCNKWLYKLTSASGNCGPTEQCQKLCITVYGFYCLLILLRESFKRHSSTTGHKLLVTF